MELTIYPTKEKWASLLARPLAEPFALEKKVSKILEKVRKNGDKAIRKYTEAFDGITVKRLLVSEKEMTAAIAGLDTGLKNAIEKAASNIRQFHTTQLSAEPIVEIQNGIQCWRKSVGIEKVGLYIPGGTAPLFSTVLMLGIPATLAGCREVILCTPPQKDGAVHPAVLFAAQMAGITKVFKVGGAQAIAAMAYGTESIPQVYKIFGPGNQFVTCAKQLVQADNIAIDMPAGPSEVCVLADHSANPSFVAADLLSQAEHGIDSQVLLVTTDTGLYPAVKASLDMQLASLPRKDMAKSSLENSKAILVNNMDEAIELVNAYAAEHLILACENDKEIATRVVNAGSVFLGHYSPESAGDYASGTNHTLPTNGFARSYSGVSVDSFVKKITFQKLTKEGLRNIAETVETMAKAEGLEAHARAISVRNSYNESIKK